MFKDVTQEYNRMITLSYRGGGETEYASLQIFNFLGKKKNDAHGGGNFLIQHNL